MAGLILCAHGFASTSVEAQEVPNEEEAVGATDAAGEPEASDRGAEAIVPPVAIDTPVGYPEGGSGSHVVILELLVNADGTIGDAQAVSGEPTFGQHAESAARSWRFEPATQDGEAAAARIRFEVRFEPPIEEDTPERTSEDAPAPPARVPPAETSGDQEVFVHGERAAEREGQTSLSRASVRQLPGTFGDAFRAVETLPGVTPIVSGLPYFYVRGAPPGNVGYFLDGIRVPLLFHVAAGPSVIHPAFIESVDLYPGPYPARYGRFTGGIVAGETAPPEYDHRGELSVRLVDAGGMVETHAFDRRLSIMAAGRYSYTALIASLVAPDLKLSYWDYQARVKYDIGSDQSLTLFAFGALDQASDGPRDSRTTLFDLKFHRYDLRYDRRFEGGAKLRAAVLAGTETSGVEGFDLSDRLVGGRVELENPLSDSLLLRSGVDLQTDRYTARFTEDLVGDDGDIASGDIFPARLDVVTGARADLVWEATPEVRVIPGLRFDFFVADGTPLWGISPRIYAEFDVWRDVTLKHGFGVAHQLPSFVIPLPGIQPVGELGLQRAIQHSSGVEWRLPESITAEATVFQNIQINMTDTLSAVRFDDLEGGIDARGLGSARGFELLLRRDLSQRLGGYLAYTFSRSTRSFGRQTGPATFDRTHVLSSALGYQLGKGWTAGLRGTFYTGIPADPLGPRYSFAHPPRTRPFYRFDWRLEKRWTVGAQGAWWALVFEVLNTTLNREQVFLDCSQEPCSGEPFGPVTIPSIGVEASF